VPHKSPHLVVEQVSVVLPSERNPSELRARRINALYSDAGGDLPLAVRTPPRIDDLSAQVRQLESRLTIATVRRPQQRKERSVRRDTHGPAVGRQPSLRA